MAGTDYACPNTIGIVLLRGVVIDHQSDANQIFARGKCKELAKGHDSGLDLAGLKR